MAEWVTAAGAISAIKPGSSIIMPPGCGEAVDITAALVADSERLDGTRIYGGLLLGEYPFLAEPYRQRLPYGTWHVMRSARPFVDSGEVAFYPIRGGQVTSFLLRKNLADVVVVQVSPPDAQGYCSLGVSTSYPYPMAKAARMVIAEVNPNMPRTLGPCKLHLSEITYAVATEHPLVEYQAGQPDTVSRQIAAHIEGLIPDGAAFQVGIGGIPEAMLLALKASGRKNLRIYGMGIDGAVDLWEAGLLAKDGAALIGAELMGTRRLFDWVHENPHALMVDFPTMFDGVFSSAYPTLVSVNSTLEIDLWGNCNSEVAGKSQISGVGGGVDFIELGIRNPGCKSVVALTATAKGGTISKIIPRLTDVPHTIPRSTTQYVVTEYGAVDLSLLSLDQRAEAMIGIAAPQFRDGLWESYRQIRASQ